MRKLLLISLLLFAFHSYSQELSKKELKNVKKNGEFIAADSLIHTKNLEFSANKALPLEGPSIDLTTNPNYLIIKEDSVYCSMPFFGRAFNINYNEPGGFHFSGITESFKIVENSKKKTINVTFKYKDSSDSYQFQLSINNMENTSLTIFSNNRASISYWGRIDSMKKIGIN